MVRTRTTKTRRQLTPAERGEDLKSSAATVGEYLDQLTPERREAVSAVREVVLANLPDGYEEIMDFGMISYVVPLERYPKTYNGHPLSYAGIASEKRHVSVHLMNIYSDADTERWFVDSYKGHRQAARHGQVVRSLQEAGGPAARPYRRGCSSDTHGGVDTPLRGIAAPEETD